LPETEKRLPGTLKQFGLKAMFHHISRDFKCFTYISLEENGKIALISKQLFFRK